jgi:hypothetical protein
VKTLTKQTKLEQVPALAEITRRPQVRAEDIAKHFAVSKRCVLLWAKKGIIPSTRISNSVRFDLEAVLGAVK